MLLLKVLFRKLSKMNKYNAFIESYAMGEMLAVLPTGLGKSAIYQLISKGPYSQRHIKNRRRTPCFLLAYKETVPSPSSASETYSLRTKQVDVFYKINHIFVGRTVQHCM